MGWKLYRMHKRNGAKMIRSAKDAMCQLKMEKKCVEYGEKCANI